MSKVSDPSFQIAWHRVSVSVELDRAGKLEGAFACPDDPHTVSESLLELLDVPERFVPFFPDGEERPVLLNRDRIVSVEIKDEKADEPEGDRRPVTFVLRNDAEIGGMLLVSAPRGHTRTQDVLNDTPRFVYFEGQEGQRLLLNVRWIILAGDVGDVEGS